MRPFLTNASNIAISAFALASNMGCSAHELRSNLQSQKRALSFAHRFSDRIASPLGEIPWESLGIDPRLDSDQLLLKACQFVTKKLFEEKPELRSLDKNRIGLFVGTTTSGVSGFFHLVGETKNSGLSIESLMNPSMQQSFVARLLAKEFSIHGPVYTFSSSCAASAQALAMAHDAIQMNWVDAAVVIGADVLNPVTLHGFDCLQLLDPNYCEPFTASRAGINLSESVVALLLQKSADPKATRIRAHAAVSEAHHMTQPSPGGEWMGESIRRALIKADLKASDLNLINPHGTGTDANDTCEMKAIEDLGQGLHKAFPSKRLTGHSLGASGTLEVLISSIMLEEMQKAEEQVFALKNSFGFGGANVSLVLERGGR
jgi:3-oxoacyl-[acyl-carrier-protein] synthase-1